MAKSVLSKSLKLFDEDLRIHSMRQLCKDGIPPETLKKRNAKVQRNLPVRLKKTKKLSNPIDGKTTKNNKTSSNLRLLKKIEEKKVPLESAHKLLDYQLTKSHKKYKALQKPASSSSVFTEEDFKKFESEYFTKH